MSDTENPRLSLYYFDYCPFCMRVVHAAKKLGVQLEMRDIHGDRKHLDDLMAARGRATVPVLRIEGGGQDQWMPESRDIIRYLQERFG